VDFYIRSGRFEKNHLATLIQGPLVFAHRPKAKSGGSGFGAAMSLFNVTGKARINERKKTQPFNGARKS
jgi:hypothetical protein